MEHGTDSKGQPIQVGNKVRFRGKHYTIKNFGKHIGACHTQQIFFEEPQHVNEIADEISVDLITVSTN